ncbi:NADP-dependent oxidoreductase domain-containing protein [Xylariales sp. PMI_506]|nr:NADP-dependent oxidoreductase domain-containing protein [Xylariales sp. PMI_506]
MATIFPQRRLGDEYVSAIGLGCTGMSIAVPGGGLVDGTDIEEEYLRLLTTAADMGMTFWTTTSDTYGPHNTSEKVLGRWFKETGRRDEIFLATKFGIPHANSGAGAGAGNRSSSTSDDLKHACDASLRRLNTYYIDLYYYSCHPKDADGPDTDGPAIEDVVAAMAQLRKLGRIRYLGLSGCASAETLRRAHAAQSITAAELQCSALTTPDPAFIARARQLGVKIIASAPLGGGLLAGTGPGPSPSPFPYLPGAGKNPTPSDLALAEALAAMAERKGCTPGQLALAWVLAQGGDFIPIPGITFAGHLLENAGALSVRLSGEDEKEIRAVVDKYRGQ